MMLVPFLLLNLRFLLLKTLVSIYPQIRHKTPLNQGL